MGEAFSDAMWEEFRRRWRQGAYRAGFFCEMVLADLQRFGPKPTLLDIGCGRGFDGDLGLQQSLAARAGQYIGIEPDLSVHLSDCFTQVHRCTLEDTPLAPDSIDVAVAVFVIEHLRSPRSFFDKLSTALRPGGVFWGFTIDLRHFFAWVSLAAEGLGVKNWCLKRVGATEALRGPGHYRAIYRANTPHALAVYSHPFRSFRWMNLHQAGQLDAYLPWWSRRGGRWLDRLMDATRLPGPMLVIRLEK